MLKQLVPQAEDVARAVARRGRGLGRHRAAVLVAEDFAGARGGVGLGAGGGERRAACGGQRGALIGADRARARHRALVFPAVAGDGQAVDHLRRWAVDASRCRRQRAAAAAGERGALVVPRVGRGRRGARLGVGQRHRRDGPVGRVLCPADDGARGSGAPVGAPVGAGHVPRSDVVEGCGRARSTSSCRGRSSCSHVVAAAGAGLDHQVVAALRSGRTRRVQLEERLDRLAAPGINGARAGRSLVLGNQRGDAAGGGGAGPVDDVHRRAARPYRRHLLREDRRTRSCRRRRTRAGCPCR